MMIKNDKGMTLVDGTKQMQFSKPLTYEQQKVLTYLGLDETVFL